MIPLVLLAAAVIGAVLIFGPSSFVVGVMLLGGGLLGLMVFVATTSAHGRPGETGSVVEERHYIGNVPERERRRR
ncbi:hypothetical protein [Streptomyces sp. ODS28]|uniref:hypothetical protein n=1 Tax=Streptomyces sp. ODS28 TaxID=3136688 RepID=UPI0031E8271D